MERQRGYGSAAGLALTFSVLLLVLAIGFVVGRLVIARPYAETMPEFERRAPPEEVGAQGVDESRAGSGRVYVPPPAPPEEAPEGVLGVGESEVGELGEAWGANWPEGRAEVVSPGPEPGRGEVGGPPAREEPEEAEIGEPPRPLIPERPAEEPDAAEADSTPEVRYSIQVGLFTARAGARQVGEELTQAGYPAQIEVESRDGQTLFRVLTGRYRSEDAAREGLGELEREGFSGFLVKR